MSEGSDKRRFWSDGNGIYHVATFGERVFSGIAEWGVVIVLSGAVSVALATVYGYFVLGDANAYYVYGDADTDRIRLVIPLMILFVTITHVVSAIMVARYGASLGDHVLTLAVKRENASQLGWRRSVVRKLIGSPVLSIPYFALLLQGVLFACWKIAELFFGQSNDLVDLLRDTLTGYWSSAAVIILVVTPALVLVNHAWMRVDDNWRCINDVILDTVVVQNRILSTNRDAFPSISRGPVERWD